MEDLFQYQDERVESVIVSGGLPGGKYHEESKYCYFKDARNGLFATEFHDTVDCDPLSTFTSSLHLHQQGFLGLVDLAMNTKHFVVIKTAVFTSILGLEKQLTLCLGLPA